MCVVGCSYLPVYLSTHTDLSHSSELGFSTTPTFVSTIEPTPHWAWAVYRRSHTEPITRDWTPDGQTSSSPAFFSCSACNFAVGACRFPEKISQSSSRPAASQTGPEDHRGALDPATETSPRKSRRHPRRVQLQPRCPRFHHRDLPTWRSRRHPRRVLTTSPSSFIIQNKTRGFWLSPISVSACIWFSLTLIHIITYAFIVRNP